MAGASEELVVVIIDKKSADCRVHHSVLNELIHRYEGRMKGTGLFYVLPGTLVATAAAASSAFATTACESRGARRSAAEAA